MDEELELFRCLGCDSGFFSDFGWLGRHLAGIHRGGPDALKCHVVMGATARAFSTGGK